MTMPPPTAHDGAADIAPTAPNAKVQIPEPTSINQLTERNARPNSEVATSGPKKPPYFPEPVTVSQPLLRSGNPKPTHETSFGFAYVNDLGRSAFGLKPFVFPTGTIIVRERLLQLNANPDRLVVMVKHDKAFNPAANGWEFLSVNGDGTKVIKREKNGECLKCHQTAASNDFVFPEDKRDR